MGGSVLLGGLSYPAHWLEQVEDSVSLHVLGIHCFVIGFSSWVLASTITGGFLPLPLVVTAPSESP